MKINKIGLSDIVEYEGVKGYVDAIMNDFIFIIANNRLIKVLMKDIKRIKVLKVAFVDNLSSIAY